MTFQEWMNENYPSIVAMWQQVLSYTGTSLPYYSLEAYVQMVNPNVWTIWQGTIGGDGAGVGVGASDFVNWLNQYHPDALTSTAWGTYQQFYQNPTPEEFIQLYYPPIWTEWGTYQGWEEEHGFYDIPQDVMNMAWGDVVNQGIVIQNKVTADPSYVPTPEEQAILDWYSTGTQMITAGTWQVVSVDEPLQPVPGVTDIDYTLGAPPGTTDEEWAELQNPMQQPSWDAGEGYVWDWGSFDPIPYWVPVYVGDAALDEQWPIQPPGITDEQWAEISNPAQQPSWSPGANYAWQWSSSAGYWVPAYAPAPTYPPQQPDYSMQIAQMQLEFQREQAQMQQAMQWLNLVSSLQGPGTWPMFQALIGMPPEGLPEWAGQAITGPAADTGWLGYWQGTQAGQVPVPSHIWTGQPAPQPVGTLAPETQGIATRQTPFGTVNIPEWMQGLRRMQYGGTIKKPTWLTDMASGRTYGMAGERGPEVVNPIVPPVPPILPPPSIPPIWEPPPKPPPFLPPIWGPPPSPPPTTTPTMPTEPEPVEPEVPIEPVAEELASVLAYGAPEWMATYAQYLPSAQDWTRMSPSAREGWLGWLQAQGLYGPDIMHRMERQFPRWAQFPQTYYAPRR